MMGTKFPELFAALCAPFESGEVKIRDAPGGRRLHYITARTAFNRLDTVLGPEAWWDEYVPMEHSVLCKLSLRLPDGSVVTKCDAGGYAGMQDQGDDDKSGFSDAFKRACAKFGIARYLYRDGVPRYDGESPAPAIPSANGHREHAAESRSHVAHPSRPPDHDEPPRDAPRTGKALFRWAREMEEKTDHAVLKFLNGYGKSEGFSSDRLVDWTADEVARGYAEAVRKLRETGHGTGGAEEHPPPANPDALRKQLVNAIWRIAKADTGKDRPSDGDYFAALADLDGAVAGSGGRVIPEITDCRDPAILSAYLRAARDRLDAAGV
jgi:hypothetical protein